MKGTPKSIKKPHKHTQSKQKREVRIKKNEN